MAITFAKLAGDWRHIIEDFVTDPANVTDNPGVTGTVTITPLLGEGRHAPKGWPQGSIFYTLSGLDLRVYRGLLRDANMDEDINVVVQIDDFPVAWKASFNLTYKGKRIPLHDVVFGPNEVVDGTINVSGLVARESVPPEYEGSYQELLSAIERAEELAGEAEASAAAALASQSAAADSATNADASADAADQSRADAVIAQGLAVAAQIAAEGARDDADGHADRAEQAADSFGLSVNSTTTGAPGSNANVTLTGSGPAYGLTFTVPRGDKGEQGVQGPPGEVTQAMLDAAVASLVDGAPEALDTLEELATALGNDPNFATTVSTEIGLRAKTADVNAALAGKANTSHAHAASQVSGAATSGLDVSEAQVDIDDFGSFSVSGAFNTITSTYGSQILALNTGKANVSHTHPTTDIETSNPGAAAGTYLRKDGVWGVPTNTTYAVPSQAEAEAGTATTGRAFSAQRTRQAANAAIAAKFQVVSSLPGSPDPGTFYFITE